MSEQFARHQVVEYRQNEPFKIFNHHGYQMSDEYLPHWHKELEIVFLRHHDFHYINGQRFEGNPGDLIITSSESIHMIEPLSEPGREQELGAVVVLIQDDFLKENIPDYSQITFTNEQPKADEEITRLMSKIAGYQAMEDSGKYGQMYITGLVLQLLYYVCIHRASPRELVIAGGQDKTVRQLRDVIQYIEDHYREKISEAEVAEAFHFNPAYFSRFFKKNSGITFRDYLIGYRLQRAKQELLNTDRTILEIACDNGFSDGRRFAVNFRRAFGVSPGEFRRAGKI